MSAERSVLCMFLTAPDAASDAMPQAEERERGKWLNRWTMPDGRKTWVRAHFGPGRMPEIIDAREWIETLWNEDRWPPGTVFILVVAPPPSS